MRAGAAAVDPLELGRSMDLARLRALELLAPDLGGTAAEVEARQREQLQQLVAAARAVAVAYPGTREGLEAVVIEARALDRLSHLGGEGPGPTVWAQQAAARWSELGALGTGVPEPLREEVRYRLIRQAMAENPSPASWLGQLEGFLGAYPASARVAGLIWEAAGRLERAGDWAQAKRLYGRAAAGATDEALRRRLAGKLSKIEGVVRGFPGLAWESVDGASIRVADLQGKVVLLHFWASWNEESVGVLGRLAAICRARAPADVTLIAVSFDTDRDAPGRALASLSADAVHIREREGLSGAFAERYGVDRVPETWVLDRHGRLCSVVSDPERVAAELARLLGPAAERRTEAPARPAAGQEDAGQEGAAP